MTLTGKAMTCQRVVCTSRGMGAESPQYFESDGELVWLVRRQTGKVAGP